MARCAETGRWAPFPGADINDVGNEGLAGLANFRSKEGMLWDFGTDKLANIIYGCSLEAQKFVRYCLPGLEAEPGAHRLEDEKLHLHLECSTSEECNGQVALEAFPKPGPVVNFQGSATRLLDHPIPF